MSDVKVKQYYRELNNYYQIPIEAKTLDRITVTQIIYFRKSFLFENPILIGTIVIFSSLTIRNYQLLPHIHINYFLIVKYIRLCIVYANYKVYNIGTWSNVFKF